MFSSSKKLSFGDVTQDCFVQPPACFVQPQACFIQPQAIRDPAPSRHRINALAQPAEVPPLHSPSQKIGPLDSQQLKKNRILEQLATIFPDYSR